MSFKLISSPLQGFTDYRFRNPFNKYFGGIDIFYAPYIRLNGKFIIRPNYEKDILPENNKGITIIPQIMTNDADEFIFVAKFVKELGYSELNWNLGCPYPMVTKRGMGSGLINDPIRISEILERVHNETDINVSMKMRLGYETNEETFNTIPTLNKFPIKSIAIHARLGKQLYKGNVDLDAFRNCLDQTNIPIYYNGDIVTLDSFLTIKNNFKNIDNFLIGRGLIHDPFLPTMIKNNTAIYPDNRWEVFSEFHDILFETFANALSGKSHVLTKMTSYWEYFSNQFEDPHKTFKKIKKSKSINAYETAVQEILYSAKNLTTY